MENEIQTYLSTCESYLSNPENVEPNELAQYFASYSNYGVNDCITSLVQRYFYFNLNHPQLMHYMHLLDRLIKFSFPLPHSFVNMFAQCYLISVQNGRKTQQEELKILRKMWTPHLNDHLIAGLREEAFKLTKIDIEVELRQESKKFLTQYFQKYLNLSPQEINDIVNKVVPLKIQPAVKMPPRYDSENLRATEKRKNPPIEEKIEPTKRHPALMMYEKLRNLYNFTCKECGRHFHTEEAYQGHKDEHFQNKMGQFKHKRLDQFIKKSKFRPTKTQKLEKTVNQWINSTEQNSNEQNITIPLGEELGVSKECHFCGRQFDIQINDDSFIYKRTLKVNIYSLSQHQGQEILMHLDCYHALAETQML